MARLELGAIQFEAEYKDGQLVYGSPRIEVLQDNSKEIAHDVPDGKYTWVLVLDIETAKHGPNQWYGRDFCPHPDKPCIDGCSFCGTQLEVNNHNHTLQQRNPDKYECVWL